MSEKELIAPEIKKIENEIVEYLLRDPLFGLQQSINSTIKAYFITRKSLTQATIFKLTRYSRGKISQELKKLMKTNFIKKAKTSSKGEITYVMNSATLGIFKNVIFSQKEVLDFFKEINEVKKEMDLKRSELENLYGYKDIYELISLFTASLPLTVGILKEIEKEMSKLEGKL